MLANECSDIEDEMNYNENEIKATKAYSVNKEFLNTMIPGKDENIASERVDKLIEGDPMLTQYKPQLMKRYNAYLDLKSTIEHYGEGLDNFSMGYKEYGFNRSEDGIWYREWAPGAIKAFLTGEFNKWNVTSHEMTRNQNDIFEIFLPNNKDGTPAIKHNTRVKLCLILPTGERVFRVPAWIKRAVQNLRITETFQGVYWDPPQPYVFKHKSPPKPKSLRIYEAHIGIASPELKIASYKEFTQNVLPRIKYLNYNTLQIMAVMEHPYYASFGYQVSSFFAPSSRFGTPEDLMELIDTAHGMGIYVLLDVIHAHACKNTMDGLNRFDGTDHQYFHPFPRGYHSVWKTLLFNYTSLEVLRFLLSNLRYWIEEYHFDGFRFDGVTSMLYLHHGIGGVEFTGNYEQYFSDATDLEALSYLMVANDMLHTLYPNCTTIAEDVSGMPGLCIPLADGGCGFDYRLGMGIPDMWINLIGSRREEEWPMNDICWTLTNRRDNEKTIAYCECHDQALVGDKTIAFWLMDKEMYDYMSDFSKLTPLIERGIALHKMIRLITSGLGGESYLNFIGNEFGHPEWLDFPRKGNNNSFQYARRQFNLPDDPLLRYRYLYEFDRCMNELEEQYGWLNSPQGDIHFTNQIDKVITFERGNLLWVFNFHSWKSFADYKVGTKHVGIHDIVLNTDNKKFGGFGRIDESCRHFSQPGRFANRDQFIKVYIPNRTALVFKYSN